MGALLEKQNGTPSALGPETLKIPAVTITIRSKEYSKASNTIRTVSYLIQETKPLIYRNINVVSSRHYVFLKDSVNKSLRCYLKRVN